MKLSESIYFKTIEDLVKYSHDRLNIRYNGNQRIHRSKIGLLKTTLLNNSPLSECKKKKCPNTFLKCQVELEFRIIIKMLRLPISTKIL